MDRRNVEDIYPLSPLQQGMLFHSVYSEGAAYQEQVPLLLRGEVDADALERAFQGLVARHGALRIGFAWEGVPQPLQFVLRQARPAFERLDWRAAGDGWRARLDALLEADLRRGHDLKRPPLLRVTLVRIDGGHVMLLSMHHAVTDGWSLPLLIGDLAALYHAERTGRPAALPPAPRYRDYVQWLVGHDAAEGEAFWRGALAGFARATPLPLDRGGSPHAERHGKEVLRLDTAAVQRAQAFARAQGVTLNTLAQAAWALLLARHSGDEDVVFGATVSGRPPEVAGVERMVGLFINTVPVRVRVDGSASVGAWLRALQQAQAETRQYEHARLVDVHGWSPVPRDAPLFESLLVFENYPIDAAAGDDDDAPPLQVEALPGPERSTYALGLICAPWPDGLELRLAYDAARFTPDAARRIVAGAAAALDAVCADADRPAAALSVLTAADRAELDAWGRGAPLDAAVPVHVGVAAQAARTPGARAVEAADGTLTYAELDARAAALAAGLRAQGVGRGALVAVCMDRRADLPAAFLAVLKAGAAYVPIDPTYPAERIRWMLEDSGASVVLTTAALAPTLPETPATLFLVDEPGEAARPGDPADPVDSADLAFVIYTSGSTGRPKGAAIPHGALANNLRWMQGAFPLGADDRVLQRTPVSFDASVWEFWAPLLAGATLVMGGPDAHRDPAAIAAETVARGITTLQLVTSLLRAVLEEPAFARGTSLRRLFQGGEGLPTALARRAREIHPHLQVVNLYGPAEVCVDATSHVFDPSDESPGVPLGAPIANLRAYVLDASRARVPAGAAGELWLAGAGVGRGYLGRPGMTADRWMPDPFGGVEGARMYRTGDRARWRTDGILEFLGRADLQVKVRGVRVEPGDVEAALEALPGVRETAVALRGEGAAARLVAWVVASGDASPDALAKALRGHLPEPMIPTVFALVDALPRTPGGKLDRAALPDPGAAPAAAYVEPRTDTERALAAVWREVLGVERVGADDSFFASGGHSLLAMQLSSRARAALEVEVPVRAIFDHPRLADLAAWIDGESDAGLEALLREMESMSDAEAAALADAAEEG